ncbi:uncharacterized protein LOC129403476, partial [Sorex araneus]|uniref:uncharacterized protein LOC129403476 n=1 Tax=Sorex araneus TaxID=42254 RepID=UPI002433FC0B
MTNGEKKSVWLIYSNILPGPGKLSSQQGLCKEEGLQSPQSPHHLQSRAQWLSANSEARRPEEESWLISFQLFNTKEEQESRDSSESWSVCLACRGLLVAPDTSPGSTRTLLGSILHPPFPKRTKTEVVIEARAKEVVQTQDIKILRELYCEFTTRISPFYKEVIIDVKRGVRQGDTISLKLFSAALKNIMRRLEWEGMGVKIDSRQSHHLRFADDIILKTPNISQVAQMLADFDHKCGKVGLQLNPNKTMFMKNKLVPEAPFALNGTNISECSSYVYLGREINMRNDLAPELPRRKRAAWNAFKSIKEAVKRTKNLRLWAHFLDSTVLPALTYTSE